MNSAKCISRTMKLSAAPTAMATPLRLTALSYEFWAAQLVKPSQRVLEDWEAVLLRVPFGKMK